MRIATSCLLTFDDGLKEIIPFNPFGENENGPYLLLVMNSEGVIVKGQGNSESMATMIDMFLSRNKEIMRTMVKNKLEIPMIHDKKLEDSVCFTKGTDPDGWCSRHNQWIIECTRARERGNN